MVYFLFCDFGNVTKGVNLLKRVTAFQVTVIFPILCERTRNEKAGKIEFFVNNRELKQTTFLTTRTSTRIQV
jgi:hypothetical protein